MNKISHNMFFTRRVPGQHDMSVVVARLVALPLVCVASFLFYNLRSGAGLNENWKPLLRLRGDNCNENRPNFTDFELEFIDDSIPDCARDVFVTLHKQAGGEGEHACRGLIIRDDIIVTSKECSTFHFTFDFAGVGIVEANPHPTLNEGKVTAKSSFGFLEAHPPYHFHWIDQPVRRTRLFLSKNSNPRVNATGVNGTGVPATVVPRVNGTRVLTAVLTCGEDGKPIAHNLPAHGEMVPLLELEGIVPDGILWEDKDLQTAKKLSYKPHVWWTRPITLEEEERTVRDMIEEYAGPPGSISIPRAHKDFLKKASSLMEVVDPRGHRREMCFENYYVRYHRQYPFSGRHFFDWLDFGTGRRLLEPNRKHEYMPHMKHDEICGKKHFDTHKVHYFDDEMRARHEVYFSPSRNGKELMARYKHNDASVPPSDKEPHLYVLDLDDKFYIVDDTWDKGRYGTPKHTSIMAGRPALCAGMANFGENGTVREIDFESGHYRPGIRSASIIYQWMKDQGFNMTALRWAGRTKWSTKDCGEKDWEEMKINGYNATALNSSCHEMTVSPTWFLKKWSS